MVAVPRWHVLTPRIAYGFLSTSSGPWPTRWAWAPCTSARRRGMRMAPGSTLGCVACRHAGVQPPRTPTRCGSLVSRDAARGVTAVAINVTRTHSVHPTGLRGGGRARRRRAQGHEKVQALRAAAVPPSTQANPASQVRARRCVVATLQVHARPRRARSAQHPGNQERGGDALTVPAIQHGSTAEHTHPLLRTATAAPKSTGGSGAPAGAVWHPCGATARSQTWFTTTRLDVVATQDRPRGRGKRRKAAVMLTVGRRCRRGRPDEGVS
jgi:hypothetical protein